tara:strand:- start:447 stop:974 length:528 start_codon:yes stop_codon:yes gene_type:complete
MSQKINNSQKLKKSRVSKKKPRSSSSTKSSNDLKKSLDHEKEKYLRMFAEFENYKKRTSKERVELFKTAGQDIITSLLPVLDDFERASLTLSDKSENKDVEGFLLIKNKFEDILKNNNLIAIDTKIGDSFDAEIHEAISQIPSEKENKGKVIDIIEKGYFLGEKIIRYPKVIVGQ